jgi:hypothetical protein
MSVAAAGGEFGEGGVSSDDQCPVYVAVGCHLQQPVRFILQSELLEQLQTKATVKFGE